MIRFLCVFCFLQRILLNCRHDHITLIPHSHPAIDLHPLRRRTVIARAHPDQRFMEFIRKFNRKIRPFSILPLQFCKKHHTAALRNAVTQKKLAPLPFLFIQPIVKAHRIIRPFKIICRIQPPTHRIIKLTAIFCTTDHKMSVFQYRHPHPPLPPISLFDNRLLNKKEYTSQRSIFVP